LQVGDFEELKAVTLVFCKDRKTLLMIGSVKLTMGHTEEAAELCDVTDVITDMESGFIPPRICTTTTSERL
jgi:fatty acid synthase